MKQTTKKNEQPATICIRFTWNGNLCEWKFYICKMRIYFNGKIRKRKRQRKKPCKQWKKKNKVQSMWPFGIGEMKEIGSCIKWMVIIIVSLFLLLRFCSFETKMYICIWHKTFPIHFCFLSCRCIFFDFAFVNLSSFFYQSSVSSPFSLFRHSFLHAQNTGMHEHWTWT